MVLPLLTDISEKTIKDLLSASGYREVKNPNSCNKDKLTFVVPQSKRKKWFGIYDKRNVLVVELPKLDKIETDMNQEFLLRADNKIMKYFWISKTQEFIELKKKKMEKRDYFVPFGNLFEKL